MGRLGAACATDAQALVADVPTLSTLHSWVVRFALPLRRRAGVAVACCARVLALRRARAAGAAAPHSVLPVASFCFWSSSRDV